MYFKIYTVKAENNLPADQSKAVNFELTDPSGTVVKKQNTKLQTAIRKAIFILTAT
jgi:hypothetical protein